MLVDILIHLGLGFIRVFALIWDIVSLPIYIMIYQPWKQIRARNERKTFIVSQTDEELICRPKDEPSKTLERLKDLVTMDQLICRIFEKEPHKKCMGFRRLLSVHKNFEQSGLDKVRQEDRYTWLTYQQVYDDIKKFGQGLKNIGFQPQDRVIIYADTKKEWMICALACFLNNITIVTIYTNLGEDGIVYGIKNAEATTIITSHELLPKLQKLKEQLQMIKRIIYIEHPLEKPVNDDQMISYKQMLDLGSEKNHNETAMHPINEEDIAVIMYTSGSTGNPKGVVLSHKNVISTINSIPRYCGAFGEDRYEGEAFIAYLPLAHIFEISLEVAALIMGIPVGYSSPYTLSEKSTMIIPGDKGDINLLKPTFFPAVPLILERIYKGIRGNIESRGKFFEKFIDYCFKYRLFWTNCGLDTPLLNRVIFQKMKNAIGGNVVTIVGGGAPLAGKVHNFLRTCLNTQIVQGFGLTECCGGVICGDFEDRSIEEIGYPVQNVLVKLVNWEEGGYTVKDNVGPRGELVIGGPFVAKGYYNMPELTKETFYTDHNDINWISTGDIAQLTKRGTLKIIDRKKDLVKIPIGEYVSLSKVESHLKIHPNIESICVFADPTKIETIALIVPDQIELMKIAKKLGKEALTDREVLCEDQEIVDFIFKQLCRHSKGKLEKFETPKAIAFVPESWLPETGLVTAAMKLKRKQIQMRYQHVIDRLYNSLLWNGSQCQV